MEVFILLDDSLKFIIQLDDVCLHGNELVNVSIIDQILKILLL